ncbi:hypothetical protein JEQ12_008151 [Ovis aries]|uniref:Uncharacterized protein n=1 Tax=Ovis aries TaxID=9940 RepID=A0A835ZX63_SHEEP|nr:hypothetical protein JEQ12_008151 [Ovis aries]
MVLDDGDRKPFLPGSSLPLSCEEREIRWSQCFPPHLHCGLSSSYGLCHSLHILYQPLSSYVIRTINLRIDVGQLRGFGYGIDWRPTQQFHQVCSLFPFPSSTLVLLCIEQKMPKRQESASDLFSECFRSTDCMTQHPLIAGVSALFEAINTLMDMTPYRAR